MDSHRPADAPRRIPKPVVIALVVLLVAGAVLVCLPYLFFFAIVATGGRLG